MSRVGTERLFAVPNRDVCRFTLRFMGSVSVFRALGSCCSREGGAHGVHMASSSSNPFDSQAGPRNNTTTVSTVRASGPDADLTYSSHETLLLIGGGHVLQDMNFFEMFFEMFRLCAVRKWKVEVKSRRPPGGRCQNPFISVR